MCQWSFVFHLLEFHNPMNIEIKVDDNGKMEYCCCDNNPSCAPKSTFYKDATYNNCSNKCDIFFLLSLNDESSELQSISTLNGSIKNSPPHSLYGYIFSFALVSIPYLVRHTHITKKFAFYINDLKVHEHVCIMSHSCVYICSSMSR